MQILSTKLHALLDYVWAVTIVLFPYMFFVSNDPAASWISIGAGIMTVLTSLLTNYEGGLLALIPVKIHLIADLLIALFLVASPWLFGFSSDNYLPHLIFGLSALFTALFTKAQPQSE